MRESGIKGYDAFQVCDLLIRKGYLEGLDVRFQLFDLATADDGCYIRVFMKDICNGD
jgi:hypothetical protein